MINIMVQALTKLTQMYPNKVSVRMRLVIMCVIASCFFK